MQKFRITPIGTCRIYNPLRQAQPKYPIAINAAQVYGFTHTSAEALQQLRYLQGEKTFSEQVRPILFRPELSPASWEGDWQPSDLQIVEISSAKKITSGGDSVQINYLYRFFSEFFASGKRTQRFWSLVKRDQRGDLLEFLNGEPAYRMMEPADQALLAGLKLEEQDFVSIKRDMAEIADRLGCGALLFMTHVNACTPDGSTIPSRERLINWVKLAAGQLGVPCFDPTEAMDKFGQERALEQDGLDLTHFTQAFSNRVYAEIHREHVGPLVEGRPELAGAQADALRHQLLAENIESLIKFDDFLAGTRRLYAALRSDPEAAPLIELRGRVLSQIGDFEASIRDLEGLGGATSLSPEGLVALLQAYAGTGQSARALELAGALLGEEHESGTIYACAAAAYEQTNQPELALAHWKLAFRHDRSNLAAALKALTLLAQSGRTDQLQAWREELLEHGGSGLSGAFEIAMWALDHRDEALFTKVFGAIRRLNLTRAEALIDGLLSAGMFKAAADCLRQLAGTGAVQPSRSSARLAEQGGRIAAELLGRESFALAHELAAAAAAIQPSKVVERTQRHALSHFRKVVREAYSAGAYEAVARVQVEAGDAILAASDAALLVALALHRLDEDAAALDLLLKLHGRVPDEPPVLRWAGRIAAALGRYEIALPMYSALRASGDPGAERFGAEADRFFETADRRAMKQLREAIVGGEFRLALQLAALLRAQVSDHAGLGREMERLNRRLRVQLGRIEKGEADEEDRGEILSLLLRLKPDDTAILRRSALEAMRKMRFGQAAELWGRLNQLAPEVESNARNLERCRVLAARAGNASAAPRLEPVT